MPAYDYLCQTCGNRFEQRQKMTESAVEACPACGGSVRRLITGGAGVISHSGGGQANTRAGCASGGPCCSQDAACDMACGCGH